MNKNTYTQEEVIILLKAFHLDSVEGCYSKKLLDFCNNWIEYNIKKNIDFETYFKDWNLSDKWLSVEEDLPEFDIPFLAYSPRNDIYIAYRYENFYRKNGITLVGTTHWLPLPNPPCINNNI